MSIPNRTKNFRRGKAKNIKEGNKMKGIVKFAFAAVLLAVLVTAFAGEAPAAGLTKPDWVRATTILGPHDIVKTGKDITKGDYLSVRVGVTYRNNQDSGRILKAIFDKTITFTDVQIGDTWMPEWHKRGTITITSSKINQVEIWPNNTIKLIYFIPLSQFLTPGKWGTWKSANESVLQGKYKAKFKSWSHGFNVRSENL
jgi:hypothetical protein